MGLSDVHEFKLKLARLEKVEESKSPKRLTSSQNNLVSESHSNLKTELVKKEKGIFYYRNL